MTSSRHLKGALSLASLLLAACGGSGAQPVASCVTDPDCGEGAYCLSGACRASAAPAASIELPGPLVSAKSLLLQAVVTDPDPADAVTSHAWTVARVDAGCDAEPEPTAGATLEVVFWCAGTYDVTLVATDRHGVPSAPATRRVEVAESLGLPTVVAAATVASVGHRCAGQPLACGIVAPISLSAIGADPGNQPLEYRWVARPQSPLVTAASATFAPAPTDVAPSVDLATAGTAIAGDWAFVVRVTNLDGFLGRDRVVVRVDNRPPEPTTLPLAIDHVYQAGTYLASGKLDGAAVDPDGDPVTVATTFAEPDGSGCTGTFDRASAAVSIACTGANQLIGGVSREAIVTATDVNGALAEVAVPLQIRNRPPAIRLGQAGAVSLFLEHGVGVCPHVADHCYQVAGAQPFVTEDPDGDPLTEVLLRTGIDPGATHTSGELNVNGPGTWRISTPISHPLEFREPITGASPFYLDGQVMDPFHAVGVAVVPIVIGNRPPLPAAAVTSAFAQHAYAQGEYRATFDLTTFADPDGDPMVLTGDPGARDCADFTRIGSRLSVTCRLPWSITSGATPPLAAFLGTRPIVVGARDAWSAGPIKATTSATIGNRSPTLASPSGPSEQRCICDCFLPLRLMPLPSTAAAPGDSPGPICDQPILVPDGRLTLDPGAADEDGDPLLLTFEQLPASAMVTKTALPQDAPEPFQGIYDPTTWTVTATDGASPVVSGTASVTSVTCPDEGSPCQ